MLAYIGAVSISIVKQTYFFEFHDLAYGVGFLIIYYAFQKNKYTAEEFLVFLMAIIATILAAKRIAILGLLVVLLLNFALKSTKVKNREKLIQTSYGRNRFNHIWFCFTCIVWWILELGNIR